MSVGGGRWPTNLSLIVPGRRWYLAASNTTQIAQSVIGTGKGSVETMDGERDSWTWRANRFWFGYVTDPTQPASLLPHSEWTGRRRHRAAGRWIEQFGYCRLTPTVARTF